MKRVCTLLFGLATVALSARGAGYESFYLTRNTTANFVGEVTADGLTYKAYAIRNGERWAVLTARDKTQTRLDVPGAVTFEETSYPVRAVSPQSNTALGGWYWGKDTTLREIFLTNGVVEVDSSAFSYCQELTNVVLGTSLRVFGDGVLQGNPKLKRVVLPEGLEKIGTVTFYQNSGIEEVVWPSTLEDVPTETFYASSLKSIVWPTHGGPTHIGVQAFASTQLVSLDLPDTVASCDRAALSMNSKLTSVRLSTNLTALASQLFNGCSSLTSVVIPESVTVIGEYAFSQCRALPSLTLPSGLQKIESYAFDQCESLASIAVPVGITDLPYSAFSNCRSLASVSLPDGLRSLGGSVFSHCALQTIDLPSSLTSFGSGEFNGCTALTAIAIPEGIETIPSAMFQNCTALTTVTLPSTLKTIGTQAFDGCTALTTINLPAGLTAIGDNAFLNCRSLTSLDWPASLGKIDRWAFSGCSKLTSVEIGASVVTIGDAAFRGCAALASISVAADNPYYTMRSSLLCNKTGNTVLSAPGTLTELYIPDGVTTIAAYAFAGRPALKKIHIPDSVTSIGTSAFDGCINIADVTSPGRWAMTKLIAYDAYRSALTNVTVLAGCERLADGFCQNCAKLQKVTLPDSLRDLGRERAFDSCTLLSSIDLPAAVTNLGTGAFTSTALRTLEIPDGVTAVPKSMCYGCRSLESVALHDGVTSIGGYAFYNCEKLELIDLPSALETIGDSAFGYCARISSFALPSTLRTIGASAFSSCTALTEIVVPDGVQEIADRTFYGCEKLWSVELPDTVTSIGYGAFARCFALSSFRLPSQLKTIGQTAFEYCRALPSLEVPEGVTQISNGAFSGCSGLMSVKLPKTLVTLGEGVFAGCSLLKEVVLPEGLQTIGNGAFNSCTSLRKLNIPASVTSLNNPAPYTYKLETINVDPANPNYCSIGGVLYNKALTELISVPHLCRSLEIPASLTTFSTSQFSDRAELEEIRVDPDNPSYASKDGVLYDKAMTRVLCVPYAVKSVEIADSCETLSAWAFQYANDLRTVSVPARFTPIKSYFRGNCYRNLTSVTLKGPATEVPVEFCASCTSLVEVHLPETVTRIGTSAFSSCQSLTSLFLPDGVKEIGASAFYGCSSLRDLTLGNGVTNIGASAFYSCRSLTFLELPPSVASVGNSSLETSSALTLLVDGPPPRGIAQAGLYSNDIVLRPRAYSNEWASAGLPSYVKVADLPEEGVTWTADTSRNWAEAGDVYVHKGVIAADEVWPADKTHVVYGWVTVSNGVTVTAEKGAVVKFCDGMGLLVRCGGTFVGEGVTFANVHDDDVGGDSDRDYGINPPRANAYTLYGRILDDDETAYRGRLFTYGGGSTLGDETWTSGNIYYLTGDVTLPRGKTLTVEPGAIVKIGYYNNLYVRGTLDVRGTRTNPAVFTSYCDDEYGGDTDGTDDSPVERCWKAVCMDGVDAQANIKYALFRYGGGRQQEGYGPTYTYGAVRVGGGVATLDGCTFTESFWGGIQVNGGRVTAQNCLFVGNEGCAVYSDGGEATILNSVVYDCAGAVGNQARGSNGKATFANCIVHSVDSWENAFTGNLAFDHCCFHSRTDGETGCSWAGANGNIHADPLLKNPANGDFRIADDSPCVDAGLPVSPETDHYGQHRQNAAANPTGEPDAFGRYHDIGLYEVMPIAGAADAADLEVYDVLTDHTALCPETLVTISYKVRNVAPDQSVKGVARHDRIDLVAENGIAFPVATVVRDTNLAAGKADFDCVEQVVVVPSMPTGVIRVRVTVNAEREVFEGLSYDNNRGEATGCTLEVDELTLNELVSHGTFTLPKGGSYSCRIVGTLADDTLVVLHASEGDRLVVRTASGGALPTETLRDAESVGVGNGDYLVTLRAGDAITISNLGEQTVSFTVESVAAGLSLYSPYAIAKAVNTNYVYVGFGVNQTQSRVDRCTLKPGEDLPRLAPKLPRMWMEYAPNEYVKLETNGYSKVALNFWGNCFADDMSVTLVGNGRRIEPDEQRIFTRHSAYASFNVYGAEPGLYALEVRANGHGAQIQRLVLWEPLEYYRSDDTELKTLYVGIGRDGVIPANVTDFPNPLRADRIYDATVNWWNPGDLEADARVVRLRTKLSQIRLSNADPWQSKIDFVALGANYPYDKLQPHESGSLNFELICPKEDVGYDPMDKSHDTVNGYSSKKSGGGSMLTGRRKWEAHTVRLEKFEYTDTTALYDRWDLNEPYYRPEGASDELWSFIVSRMKADFGPSESDYVARLRERAREYAASYAVPPPIVLVNDIFQSAIEAIVGDDRNVPSLCSSCDSHQDGRGTPITLQRFYATGLMSRLTDGLFGMGWHTPLEIRMIRHSTGKIYVGVPGQKKTLYVRNEGSSEWENAGAPGKSWLATADGDTDITKPTLEMFPDGSFNAFDLEGRYLGSHDGHGNSTAVSYLAGTNGPIRLIEHSDNTATVWLRFDYEEGATHPYRACSAHGVEAEYSYVVSGDEWLLAGVKDKTGFEQRYEYRDRDATAASRALARIVTPGFATRDVTWTGEGRIAQVTADGRFVTEFIREGATTRIVNPDGTAQSVAVNAAGKVMSRTDENGNVTRCEYASGSKAPTALTLPSGKRVGMVYTSAGELASLTMPKGGTVTFSYDSRGALTQVLDADGGVRKRIMNKWNEKTAEVSPEGVVRRYSYNDKGDLVADLSASLTRGVTYRHDEVGRVMTILATNTPDRVDFTRNARGEITAAADSVNGTIRLEYDATNRLVRFTTAEGHVRHLAHDAHHGLAALTDPAGEGERYVYDRIGRLSQVVDARNPENVYLTCQYADGAGGDGSLVRERFGNGMETVYSRDSAGRLIAATTRLNGTTLADFHYFHDADGLIVGRDDADYTYDEDGQLTGVDYADGSTESFAYDAAGRPQFVGVTAVDDLETGNLSRMTLDNAGTVVCGYDSFDRMVSVTNTQSGLDWRCQYDAFGGRVKVAQGGTEKTFVRVPRTNRVLDEYVGGTRTRHHIWTKGRRIATLEADGTIRYLVSDNIGSVRVVVDGEGQVTGRATFTAFGGVKSASGADAALCGWCAAAGVETDPTGFHYMLNRYYSKDLRRFTSSDPIGLLGGDENCYRYCGNDPIGACDPLGLKTKGDVGYATAKVVKSTAFWLLDFVPEAKVIGKSAQYLKKGSKAASRAKAMESLCKQVKQATEFVNPAVKATDYLETFINADADRNGLDMQEVSHALTEITYGELQTAIEPVMDIVDDWKDMYDAWDEFYDAITPCD